MTTLTELLYKFKDREPKQFGFAQERCYPVSAVMDIVIIERKECALAFLNWFTSDEIHEPFTPDFKTREDAFDWFLSHKYTRNG